MEPARVLFPDRANDPGRLAVELADLQLLRQDDLAHQRVHVLAGVHAGDGLALDPGDRSMQGVEVGADPCRPADRLAVSGDQQFGLERAHLLHGAQVRAHQARLVAAHRDEVRHRPPDRPEEVAGERGALVRQPHEYRAQRLAARSLQHLDAPPALLEGMAIGDLDVRNDPGRCRRRTLAPRHRGPELARATVQEGAELIEKIPGVGEPGAGDHLRAGFQLFRQGAVMIGMGLRHADPA